MSDVIISVENLGKKYRIRHQAERQRYAALRDVIAQKARGVFQMLKLRRQKTEINNAEGQNKFQLSTLPSSEDFWALKDVSFEVKQGEVVGIIGRNGAGKSTLLKILSRITEPTEGRVRIRGRVASLLEVGTGFHPELTGRENIFLNGAILGMHRAEIKRKFDEIVAFAEVEKFLDTPVKRYSSGMYVRLAFAVAAHLEPEILIVDRIFDLPYQSQIVPLAAILADIGDAWEHDTNRAKLVKWYWNGVFGELYGSAVETRMARDFMEVPVWLNDGPEPSTVSETMFRADRLKTMRMRLSAAYKGVNALLMKEGAQDFRSGQKFDHTMFFGEEC